MITARGLMFLDSTNQYFRSTALNLEMRFCWLPVILIRRVTTQVIFPERDQYKTYRSHS